MSTQFEHTQNFILNPQEKQELRCRYCYQPAKPLISVCACSGSIAYVHQDCVLDWITKKIENADRVEIPSCEICHQVFSARMKVGKKKLCLSILKQKISNMATKDKLTFVGHVVLMVTAIFTILSFMVAVLSGELSLLTSFSTIMMKVFTHFIAEIYVILWFRQLLKEKKWMINESIVQIVEVTLKPKLIIKK